MRQPWFIKFNEQQAGPEFLASLTMSELERVSHSDIAYLVVDGRHPEQLEQVIRRVRSSSLPSIYLLPIVCLFSGYGVIDKGRRSADAYHALEDFNQTTAEEYVSQFDPINRWIDTITLDTVTADVNIAFRVLRFIASRAGEFTPVTTAHSSAGFVYPALEPLFDQHDVGVIQTLEYLHDQRLLSGSFFTKAHFCSHCDCAFLNFEETCPHCRAKDLTIDELVHHFKCAYTGELSEFKKGEAMVCPKCEQQLKHIGVDYDKPSIVYRCNECAHVFQNPNVVSTCYSCGRSTEPENQVLRYIHSYRATSLGQNAARYGLESLFTSILDTELKLTAFTTFSDFYAIEAERIKRYKKSSSTLVMISFDRLDELYIRLGKRAREVFLELSAVFKSVLRSSDVITARNETLFLVLMTETSTEQAQIAVKRLQDGVTALFESNLDIKPEFVHKIEAVAGVDDPGSALETFLNNHVD